MKRKACSLPEWIGILVIVVFCGGESYAANPAALSGVVSSNEEGRMEGFWSAPRPRAIAKVEPLD